MDQTFLAAVASRPGDRCNPAQSGSSGFSTASCGSQVNSMPLPALSRALASIARLDSPTATGALAVTTAQRAPQAPDVRIDSVQTSAEGAVDRILAVLCDRGFVSGAAKKLSDG